MKKPLRLGWKTIASFIEYHDKEVVALCTDDRTLLGIFLNAQRAGLRDNSSKAKSIGSGLSILM